MRYPLTGPRINHLVRPSPREWAGLSMGPNNALSWQACIQWCNSVDKGFNQWNKEESHFWLFPFYTAGPLPLNLLWRIPKTSGTDLEGLGEGVVAKERFPLHSTDGSFSQLSDTIVCNPHILGILEVQHQVHLWGGTWKASAQQQNCFQISEGTPSPVSLESVYKCLCTYLGFVFFLFVCWQKFII